MRQRLNRRFGARDQQRHPAAMRRPESAMDNRYPDPLIGDPNQNSDKITFPEATISSFAGGGLGVNRMNSFNNRHSSLSVPSSPRHEPATFAFPPSTGAAVAGLAEVELDPLALGPPSVCRSYNSDPTEMLHHSMPNISTTGDWFTSARHSVAEQGHYSAPDLMFTEGFGGDDSMSELEPIPLTEITPRPASKKSISSDDFKKALSMTLSPTSPSAEAVSRDLIASLEKLTGSTIKDHNPFEPLPLGEEDEEDEPLDGSNESGPRRRGNVASSRRGMLPFDD